MQAVTELNFKEFHSFISRFLSFQQSFKREGQNLDMYIQVMKYLKKRNGSRSVSVSIAMLKIHLQF